MKLDDNIIKDRLKTNLGLGDAALKIVVVGLGVTGLSVARFLVRLGFEFVIADSREQPPELKQFQMEMPNLTVFTGKFDEDLFNAEAYLIVSPGVSLNEHAISKAIASGAKVCGDIDLFACSVDAPVIAITGSNGKSTVTTMLSDMAIAAGKRAGVGGNLGVPALDLSGQDAELYVLELSSFQLERTRCLYAVAATVLNVTADHMDRHENIADYAEQKRKVYNGNGLMVINLDDPIVRAMQVQGRQILTFSIQSKADFWIGKNQDIECLMHGEQPLLPLSELPLEGKHNAANALAALALGTAIGLDEQAMCRALKAFKGLAHRMQRIANINGVTWVNDSKATNIGACIAALNGYEHKVILIAGGDAKGADMNELVPVVKDKTKSVVLMGKDAALIEQALNGCVPVYKAQDMQQAVNTAARIAVAGDNVLLSPACASLDQYKNYQERGDKFAQAVLAIADQENQKSDQKSDSNLRAGL